MKTIEAGLNALNQSTVALAYKSHDVAEVLNTTNQSMLVIQQAVGELNNQIKQVENRGTTMKKHATRTVNMFAQKIRAIENACALTVQSLTAQLTE
jgi:phage-related minor tail protein